MCSPTSKKLCGECSTCYNRSFATHPRAIYWSSKNELEPKQVTKSSNKKFYFDCPDCEHELEMSLCNISNGQWCKYCNRDGLCNKNCEFCYKKSFASHPMAIYWSSKNEINPRNIDIRLIDQAVEIVYQEEQIVHIVQIKKYVMNVIIVLKNHVLHTK